MTSVPKLAPSSGNLDLALLLILAIAALNAYIPHMDYPYPLHVDEWFHITTANEIIAGAETDLYSGKPFTLGMERAWHLSLAAIFLLFPALKIYVFLIIAISILATLSVYSFAKRYGEKTALIAAFFAAIMPSNVTIGGPALLVPINLSLVFIPLALKHAFDKKPCYEIIFAALLFLLYAHPPSAVALLILLGPYAILNIKQDKTRAKNIFITILASLLLSTPNYISRIAEKGMESASFSFWLLTEQTPALFGYIPTLLFIAGFYMMAKTKEPQNRALIFGIIFFLLNIFIHARTGASYLLPYVRTFVPLMFIMAVMAAYALSKVKSRAVIGIILAVSLALSIQHSFQTPYYHLITESDYDNLVWIKDNSQPTEIILADPVKARAIPTITGMQVFTVLPFGPVPEILEINKKAEDFFNANCTDTGFLKENNITIIYSPVECDKSATIKGRDSVYVPR